MEVLLTQDRANDDLPHKMLEASLLDECQGTIIGEREPFSDEDELNETVVPNVQRRDSSQTNSDDSSCEHHINPNSIAADVVRI